MGFRHSCLRRASGFKDLYVAEDPTSNTGADPGAGTAAIDISAKFDPNTNDVAQEIHVTVKRDDGMIVADQDFSDPSALNDLVLPVTNTARDFAITAFVDSSGTGQLASGEAKEEVDVHVYELTIRTDYNGDGVINATDDALNALYPTPVGEEGVANRTEVELSGECGDNASGGLTVALDIPEGADKLEFWDGPTADANRLYPSGPSATVEYLNIPSDGQFDYQLWISSTTQNYTGAMSFSLDVLNNMGFVATTAVQQDVVVGQRNSLTDAQQTLVNNAKSQLAKSGLSPALQQVRLDVIIAAMTGTVTKTHPEGRNPNLWDDSSGSYVPSANSTAVAAIDDLWIVHGNDGINFNLGIYCKPYSSLIMAEAYIMYFNSTGNAADVKQAGIAKLNSLIDHGSFPGSGNREAQFEGVLWNSQSKKNAPAGGYQNLVPGDQVWFENPYFDLGKPLAIAAGKDIGGEAGSNVFYLGIGVKGQKDYVGNDEGGQPLVMSIYTKRIYTVADYQAYMIQVFDTVQAWKNAGHTVRPSDFKIMRVRSVVNPSTLSG